MELQFFLSHVAAPAHTHTHTFLVPVPLAGPMASPPAASAYPQAVQLYKSGPD